MNGSIPSASVANDRLSDVALGDRPVHPYLSVAVVMGLSLSLVGPSVSYLEERLGVSTSTIGTLFSVIAVSNIAGALVCGRWIERHGGHLALRLALIGFVAGTVLLAVGEHYVVVALGVALIGGSTGVTDASANTMVVWVRPGRSGPPLNALHLMFGLGALAAPLVSDRSIAWTDRLWPAAIMVGALSVASLTMIGTKPSPAFPGELEDDLRPQPSRRTVVTIAAFFILYVGSEVGFAGWIHTYAEDTGLEGSAPAAVTSVFWAMFALGRLLAVWASRRVSVYRIVVGACTSTVVVLSFMLIVRGEEWAVWVGAALFGLAAAPQYPTMLAFVDTRIALPARATATIVSASATGALVVPAAIGVLIDRHGPSSMPAVVLVVSAGTIVGAMVVNRASRADVEAAAAIPVMR